MKTICIYHSRDLDGWMSAAIVMKWFLSNSDNYIIKDENGLSEGANNGKGKPYKELHMLGWDYGDEISDLQEYDKVIMCDVSFPREEMEKLLFHGNDVTNKEFIWIDHHISAIKENTWKDTKYPSGLRDTNFAACELTWNFFFPNDKMPEIVRLLGRYDCFGHKGTDEEQKILEFQYGARQCISNYEDAYTALQTNIEEGTYSDNIVNSYYCITKILEEGKVIYKYLCTEAKRIYKKAFPIEFNNYNYIEPNTLKNNETITGHNRKKFRFLCANQERFNPINFGIDYHQNGYNGFACFSYKDGKWTVSLYSNKVDVSLIAKGYGGGGHKGAAGFVCDSTTILEIING